MLWSACVAILVLALACQPAVSQSAVGYFESTMLQLSAQSDGSLSTTQNATLNQMDQDLYTISSNTCSNSSVLTVEAWWGDAISATGSTNEMGNGTLIFSMSKGIVPYASYNATLQRWLFSPSTALYGFQSQTTSRNYSMIATSFGLNRQTFGPNSSMISNDWYIMILNPIMGMGLSRKYILRATCSAAARCLSPDLEANQTALQCSGQGSCQMSQSQNNQSVAVCSCDPGYGGQACELRLKMLQVNYQRSESGLAPDQVQYYYFDVPQSGSNVVVEMTRSRGDPILIMKSNLEGLIPSDVPQRSEFSRFGDLDSYNDRLDTAAIGRYNVSASRYFVAVFNSPKDVVEPAVYNVTVRYSSQGQILCPFRCNQHGTCGDLGVCQCDNGWGGEYCQGEVIRLNDNVIARGALNPGQWRYYRYQPRSTDRPLQVDFWADGGHSVLLASWRVPPYPTYTQNSFIFRSNRMVGQTSQELSPIQLKPGPLIFAIFDMDFDVHEGFNYSIRASWKQGADTGMILKAVLGTVGGVVGAALVLILILWKLGFFQRYQAPPQQSAAHRSNRPVNDQRMHPDELVVLREYIRDAGELAGEECSICVQNVMPGDRIYHVPCKHTFHAKYGCLERWLLEYSNRCPICNRELGRSRQQIKDANPRQTAATDLEMAAQNTPRRTRSNRTEHSRNAS